ncbi:GntR family transcriptional regulator [Streptomyces virginiae]|uniref:GntR family transcriptional regulator n=1 Tax=Streptomyces virginiae TaxID=1961 RepID=UPI00342AD6B3
MAGRRKGREGGYEQIAAHFRALISSEELGPGDPLPSMRSVCEQFGATITTVNRAYRLLQEEGLTTSTPGVGTVVRSQTRVRIPFSVYEAALSPGDKGPWERATAAQGLDGRMAVQLPEQIAAPADIAELLGVEPGSPVVLRRRRAMVGDEVVQVQEAWYPLNVAQAAGLDAPGKIVGGVLAAMAAAGLLPEEADHRVTAWVPTTAQAAELALASRVSVLVVERVTRDSQGRVLEVARITGAADRMELVYERLPLAGRG